MRLSLLLIVAAITTFMNCSNISFSEHHRTYYDESNKSVPIIYDLDLIKKLIIFIPEPDIFIDSTYNDNKSTYYYLKIDNDGHLISVDQNKSIDASIDTVIFNCFKNAKFSKIFPTSTTEAYSICILPFIKKNKIHFCDGSENEKDISETDEKKLQIKSPIETPPQPVGGFDAIQNNLIYPLIAEKQNIEGFVKIEAFVNEDGLIGPYRALESSAQYFTDSVYKALIKTEWIPATSDEKPIGVWISIPFYFKLRR
ncbi:MAG: energy transducer TonB [Candidatus Marinimicrobia bacterium]|nr:energy transducer TonB [Candidatus Neomarinimicrobiota bacterium]